VAGDHQGAEPPVLHHFGSFHAQNAVS
jgi:hypothetical protein